jgi:hypothetical protein
MRKPLFWAAREWEVRFEKPYEFPQIGGFSHSNAKTTGSLRCVMAGDLLG